MLRMDFLVDFAVLHAEERAYIAFYKRLTITTRGGKRPRET